jgi:hypothetical protein
LSCFECGFGIILFKISLNIVKNTNIDNTIIGMLIEFKKEKVLLNNSANIDKKNDKSDKLKRVLQSACLLRIACRKIDSRITEVNVIVLKTATIISKLLLL